MFPTMSASRRQRLNIIKNIYGILSTSNLCKINVSLVGRRHVTVVLMCFMTILYKTTRVSCMSLFNTGYELTILRLKSLNRSEVFNLFMLWATYYY